MNLFLGVINLGLGYPPFTPHSLFGCSSIGPPWRKVFIGIDDFS